MLWTKTMKNVAQLAARCLGVTNYTNQKYCNNWIKVNITIYLVELVSILVTRVLLNFPLKSTALVTNSENSELSLKIQFYHNFKNCSLTDACYELRSYQRGVAQLGSACFGSTGPC